MKRFILLVFLSAIISSNAFADRGYHHGYRHHYHGHSHTSVGIMFGGPSLWSYPSYYPYYSYPYYPSQTIVIQPSPTTYIEKSPDSNVEHYWYYCSNPRGYYPYVLKCNSNWQRVIPFPENSK